MSANAYDALAAIYDPWQDLYGCFSRVVLARLENELAGFRRVDSFLDLGCATGRLLLGIGARHRHVHLFGVDGSPAMLERARAKAGAERVRWRCLPLGESLGPPPVTVVGAFFNTLNHLIADRALAATFESVADVLEPGGHFFFDVNNLTGFRTWWCGERRYAGRDWSLDVASRFDAKTGRARARLRVNAGRAGGETTIEERLYTDAELAAELSRAGFAMIQQSAWAPLGDGVAGATFWHARRLA